MRPLSTRLVLTGANGLLGSALRADADARGLPCLALPHADLLQQAHALALHGDDLLVHAAANTDVEACERDPGTCYRDNLLLSEALARRAARAGARMVFVSSTGVQGRGQSEPCTEFDSATPGTHLHRSKWLAEEAVMRHHPGALVLRPSWLYGGAIGHGHDPVLQCLGAARQAATLQASTRHRGNPTSTLDFVAQMWRLVDGGHSGLFNVVARGSASRLEFLRAIVALAGLTATVQAQASDAAAGRAAVPDDESADNLKARLLGLPELPHWHDSLARHVHRLQH